jgi:hypothetical protein
MRQQRSIFHANNFTGILQAQFLHTAPRKIFWPEIFGLCGSGAR